MPHDDNDEHHHNQDNECYDAQQRPPLLLRLLSAHQLLDSLLNLSAAEQAQQGNANTRMHSVSWVTV